jgi:putative membrane protein
MKSPAPRPGTLFAAWQGGWANLLAVALLVGLLAWYLRAARARHWRPVKVGSFIAGTLAAVYALDGGLASYDRDNFTAHVVQLLVLTDIVPPLLAVGEPLRLALRSLRGKRSTLLARALGGPTARLLSNPLAGLALTTVAMYCYFLTPLYRLSENARPSLVLAGGVFLVAGCVSWWPVVGRDALARQSSFVARFAVLFISVPVYAFLGVYLASVGKPLYPVANSLSDTHTGGNLLWGLAIVLVVAGLSLLFVEWARQEEQRAARADRALDAALAAAREARPAGASERGGAQPEGQGAIEAASSRARNSPPGAETW